MPARLDPVAGGLDDGQADRRLADEPCEQADRVRAAADAGDREIGQAAFDAWSCAAASSPIRRCRSRTIVGYGCGPIAEPRT